MRTKAYIGVTGTIAAAGLVAVLLTMLTTTPKAIGPGGVTTWFLALAVAVIGWLSLGIYMLDRKLKPGTAPSAALARSARRGFLIGSGATIVLGLSSLGQLNVRDAILLAGLAILIEFYFVARA